MLEDGEGKSPSGSHGDDLSTVEEHMSAKFHFVDLAGSERVSRTGNRGERFKGGHIYMHMHMHIIHVHV